MDNFDVSPKVTKFIDKLGEPDNSRIKKALVKLSKIPPEGDIKSLVGKDGYRLKVGDYRLLFDKIGDTIIVYDIGRRDKIYKS